MSDNFLSNARAPRINFTKINRNAISVPDYCELQNLMSPCRQIRLIQFGLEGKMSNKSNNKDHTETFRTAGEGGLALFVYIFVRKKQVVKSQNRKCGVFTADKYVFRFAVFELLPREHQPNRWIRALR